MVDYIIMSANSLRYLSDFKVHKFDPLLSDIHCPISCHLLTKYKTNIYSNKEDNKGKYQTETKTKATNVCKWAKEKSEEFLNKISNDKVNQLNTYLESLDETMVNSDIINQIVENIKDVFIDAAESISNHRPKHNNECQQKSSNKWFNKECVKSRRNYRKAKRHFYKLKSDNNKKALSDALKAYKKTIKIQQKNYNKFFCKKLREIKSKDPRTFWKILCNKKGPEVIKVSVEAMFDFFKKMNSETAEMTHQSYVSPQVDNSSIDDENILNKPITEEEIRTCISKLKNHKAPGIDNIINEYITTTEDILMPVYIRVFNIIFMNGIFPDVRSKGIIVPIYKKGDKTNPDNYRVLPYSAVWVNFLHLS